jgi:hypothetical protein
LFIASWEYQYGPEKVKITADMVIEALDTAKSVVTKEIAFNEHIKDNKKFKEDYERKLLVLESMRKTFYDAWMDYEDKKIHPVIPRGRKK